MALTRITKGVIKPNENYDTHNINSTGIVTAIGLDVNGNGDISGNLSVGGVLTYEDVTSIDSVGIITAQSDIHVGGGVSAVGVGTFSGLDISGDIDVDGHTNLDNVSISGVTTASGDLFVDGNVVIPTSGRYFKLWTGGTQGITLNHGGTYGELDNLTGMMRIKAGSVNLANRYGNYNFINCAANGSVDLYYDAQNHTTPKLATSATGVTIDGTAVAGGLDISGDIDVDGHTNLDNVSVAGITTFSGIIDVVNTPASIRVAQDIQHKGDADTKITFPANDTISFDTAGDERLRIDSSGRLLINKTSDRGAYYGGTFSGKLQVEGTDNATRLTQFIHNSNAASQHILVLGKSRGTSVGSYTVVQNSDYLGTLSFQGADGDAMIEGARIDAIVSGAPGDQDMPTSLTFGTTADGASSTTERLRITGIGSIGVGGGSEVERKVDIVTSNGNSVVIRPNADAANSAGNANVVNNLIILRMPYGQNAGSSNNAGARIGVQFTGRNDGAGYVDDPSKSASVYGVSEDSSGGYARKMGLAFYTSAHDTSQTERLRITSNGRVSINDGTRSADSATEGATLRVSGTPVTRNEYFSPHGHYFGSIGYTTDTHTKAWLAVDSHYAQSSAVSAGIFLSAFHQDAGGSDCGYTIKNLKTGNALVFSRVKTAASTGNPAVEEERVRIHADGKVTFGASSTAKATVDIIQSGQSATSLSLLVGANESGGSPTTRSNSFQKAARIACPHYTNAEEPMNIVVAYSGSSTNNLYWGGGTGVMNAATQHDFYTAANNTTTNGTVRLRIDNLGKITHFADAGDNQYISKRTGSAGSNGDYFFQLFALNSGDTTVGGIGIHRDTATDDSRMVFSTRNSGGSNQERLRIKSDGSTFLQTSNVNINRGTNGAGYPLTVRGPSSGDIIRLERANSGQWHFGFDGNTNFTVKSNTTEVVRITTAGHIQLQGGIIYGDDNASNVLKLQSTSGNVNHSRIEIGASQSSDNGGIHFYTAGSSAATRHMTLKGTSGNLGIGIDNPVQKVHLYNASNDPYVRIQRGTTSNVDVGGIEFTSANTVFATMGSRVTSHSGGRGAVYIQTQEGSGTTREPLRVVANSGGFGERLISQGSGVCLFGTNGTHGNQFKDGRPELNNVYEESQSAYRSNNGAAGGTFVVTGTGSNAATTYYPVAFSLHQQFPCVLTINKYVHNYATWDGTLMFRADMSGTGYGGHVALHRVTMNIQSGKQFIGRIKFTTHNNAYLVLWMLGGGRSYHWGTIGSGVQVIRVYDDGGSYNLGPGNSSEGPITSPDTIDTGYEPNMNDSPSHQQTGFS